MLMSKKDEYIQELIEGEETETVNLAGFQVAKAELFAHTREPAITVWDNKIKFNMACLRRFPGVTHIQLLIHPDEKRLIVRPCNADAPDSLRWASGGGEKEIKTRDMICQIFAAKLFELMSWDIIANGYVNLDFLGNLGHSIVTHKDDRIYIEKGNMATLGSVKYFTFEPHIAVKGSKYGFKKENIYGFKNNKVAEL